MKKNLQISVQTLYLVPRNLLQRAKYSSLTFPLSKKLAFNWVRLFVNVIAIKTNAYLAIFRGRHNFFKNRKHRLPANAVMAKNTGKALHYRPSNCLFYVYRMFLALIKIVE